MGQNLHNSSAHHKSILKFERHTNGTGRVLLTNKGMLLLLLVYNCHYWHTTASSCILLLILEYYCYYSTIVLFTIYRLAYSNTKTQKQNKKTKTKTTTTTQTQLQKRWNGEKCNTSTSAGRDFYREITIAFFNGIYLYIYISVKFIGSDFYEKIFLLKIAFEKS